jgi:SAM-dependent methyltransferase
MTDAQQITQAVAKLYDTYPFPPEPLLDEPPPGYNWRWNWNAAYNFCFGSKPSRQDVRILDAGCGTGVGTEYLVHLNPEAQVVGIDLSAGALAVAQERCQRSGANRVEFHHLSLFDAHQLPGEFELINCVGVLHHTPDPIRGLQSLAAKLAPGGLLHVFVYGALGRWEISLMQRAIALLQGDHRGDYRDGVNIGRRIFATLPEQNRIVRREKERWSLENHRDESFADMYVHPQEIDYTVDTLFDLIDASGLDFLGFSNPKVWDLQALLGQDETLWSRSQNLALRQQYQLAELLNPDFFSHYEFFLAKPPYQRETWSDDQSLLAATVERHPCMEGWPSASFFNYNYEIVNLTPEEEAFMQACDREPGQTVSAVMQTASLPLEQVRHLQEQQLILLSKP